MKNKMLARKSVNILVPDIWPEMTVFSSAKFSEKKPSFFQEPYKRPWYAKSLEERFFFQLRARCCFVLKGTNLVHPPDWSKKIKLKKIKQNHKYIDDLMVKRFKEVCEVHSGLCDVQESACFEVFCLCLYYYFVQASSFFF